MRWRQELRAKKRNKQLKIWSRGCLGDLFCIAMHASEFVDQVSIVNAMRRELQLFNNVCRRVWSVFEPPGNKRVHLRKKYR